MESRFEEFKAAAAKAPKVAGVDGLVAHLQTNLASIQKQVEIYNQKNAPLANPQPLLTGSVDHGHLMTELARISKSIISGKDQAVVLAKQLLSKQKSLGQAEQQQLMQILLNAQSFINAAMEAFKNETRVDLMPKSSEKKEVSPATQASLPTMNISKSKIAAKPPATTGGLAKMFAEKKKSEEKAKIDKKEEPIEAFVERIKTSLQGIEMVIDLKEEKQAIAEYLKLLDDPNHMILLKANEQNQAIEKPMMELFVKLNDFVFRLREQLIQIKKAFASENAQPLRGACDELNGVIAKCFKDVTKNLMGGKDGMSFWDAWSAIKEKAEGLSKYMFAISDQSLNSDLSPYIEKLNQILSEFIAPMEELGISSGQLMTRHRK